LEEIRKLKKASEDAFATYLLIAERIKKLEAQLERLQNPERPRGES